ncbi:MAG: choice-of-anchor D domain-containing protein [Bacteroidales bacterium]|nr:choice-of-anchor D domain-containing protein [Bacteroidales bacterium]
MKKKLSVILIFFVVICFSEETSAQSSKAWSIVTSYDIPSGASGLAWDGTYLYCGIYGANGDEMYQIDPTDGSYTLYFSGGVQEDAFGLTYDGTYLWTTDHPGSSTIPAVAIQLDTDGSQVSSFNLPDHYMSGIAYDDGDFWVSTYYDPDGHIYKVDNTGTIIKYFPAPDNQPWDLCLIDGDLWMADYWGDMIYQIDTLTGNLINSYSSEGIDPSGVVYDGAFLWYIDEGSGSFDKLYKVDLSGSGTPQINLPVDFYDFGPVTVGDVGTWNMIVQNNGTADLTVTGVTVPGGQNLTVTTSFPQTVTPLESVGIEIDYSPTDYEALNAIISVESDDPINPSVEAVITGHGVFPGASIYTEQTTVDYGEVRSNAFTRRYLYIENSGDETLSIDNVTGNTPEFIIDDGVSFPFNISVLGKDSIGIWFNPGIEDSYNGTLTITSSNAINSPVTVDVSGTSNNDAQPIGNQLWNYTIDDDYDNSPKAVLSIPDITGDGIDDVIICSEDGAYRCFNGNSSGTADVLWKNTQNGSVYQQNGLQITEDINSDGYSDIIVGTAWADRSIIAVSGKTGENIWKYDTHIYGDGGWIYQVNCRYDYNNDGITDVLAASGDDSNGTGPRRIHCLDGTNGSVIWEHPNAGANFSVAGIKDISGDGIPDVLCGYTNSTETQGFASALSGSDGSEIWQYSINGTSVWAIEELEDINNDGFNDVTAGSFNYSGNGYIYILDGTNGNVIQTGTINDASLILRFEAVDDVNNDGISDIAVAHSGPDAIIIDPVTGLEIWSFPVGTPDKPWNVNRIKDISGDGINDLIAGCLYTNNYAYFLNGTDGSLILSIPYGEPIDALGTIHDIVGDNSWEMIVGGREGNVKCYSGGLDAGLNIFQAGHNNLSLKSYPNPFTDYSIIQIDMDKSKDVKIIVSNIYGQETDNIYNGFLPFGRHYFKWKPQKIMSGTYFYKVIIDDKIFTKKLIYLK